MTEDWAIMITREMLMAALERLEPWHWKATDWRKLSNWRIVRFVKWNWRAEERKCNRWG